MAITSYWFGKAIINAFGGDTTGDTHHVHWIDDEIKVLLGTSDLAPNQDTHEFISDLNLGDHEVEGAGYDAGGEEIDNREFYYDSATNKVKFLGDNVEWAESSLTARFAVIYNNTPVDDADKQLLGYVDFGEDKTSVIGDFRIQWHGDGVLKAISL